MLLLIYFNNILAKPPLGLGQGYIITSQLSTGILLLMHTLNSKRLIKGLPGIRLYTVYLLMHDFLASDLLDKIDLSC